MGAQFRCSHFLLHRKVYTLITTYLKKLTAYTKNIEIEFYLKYTIVIEGKWKI